MGTAGLLPTDNRQRRRVSAGVSLRWLGVNAWEIAFDGVHVLVDPWLTRFPATGPGGGIDPAAPLVTDTGLIDTYVGAVDLVLVTHSHFDHIADVPHLMSRFPKARVVGTETHAHLLTALGVDPEQIIWARGGEVLDFDGFTVEVVPSLHSLDRAHRYLFPGTLTAAPQPPRTVGELVEGGTLAYQVRIGDRVTIFNTGTANLVERAMTGLRPDVAILTHTRSAGTDRYLHRILTALGHPPTVIPSHHDDMHTPLIAAPEVYPDLLDQFSAAVMASSPDSQVVSPRHLRTIGL